MSEILYPAYREYRQNRIDVNDAMAAILAGSRLAAHTLSLTAGSRATLKELFPAVPHIERFDLKSDVARDLLDNADYHIASVAIPYALATHEEFVMSTLEFMAASGVQLSKRPRSYKAFEMHSALFEACRVEEPERWIKLFHVLREMRNCITHRGGAVDARLHSAIGQMGAGARDEWTRINRGATPESIIANGRLALTATHIFTVFAVAKQIGREINDALSTRIDSSVWAGVAVTDFSESTAKTKNSPNWRKALMGHVRYYYAGANISASDLEVAARSTGAWTSAKWE